MRRLTYPCISAKLATTLCALLTASVLALNAQASTVTTTTTPQNLQTLKTNFLNPPDDTRPGCYWYWINDNISTKGLTRDLEAMARVGIGRAFIGHIFTHEGNVDASVGDVKFMSDEWWEAVQWAVKEADRFGVEIGFFNAPGWSQSGGPWIKPAESMRYLGHSEVQVTGGKAVDTVLPVPEIDTFPNYGGMTPSRTGPNFSADDFQDVSVVAYRHPEENLGVIPADAYTVTGDLPDINKLFDGSATTSATVTPGQVTSITVRLSREARTSQPVQAVIIKPVEHGYTLVATIETSSDGESFHEIINHTEERGHQGPKNKSDIVIPFGGVTDEYIRLKLQFNFGPAQRKLPIAEISFSSEALLSNYVRKQLGETSPEIKIPADAYTWPGQPAPIQGTAIQSEEVIDLTDKMDDSGRLTWDAPPGTWTILRTGMIPIGTQCAPCSPESRGLEIDKLNREHAAAIFDGMVGEFLRRTPEEDRRALKYIIADSYETGPQNWTDGFIEKFETRFGYSPVRFLPVMTGRVVDSPEISDRFLWDLRRLIVESVAYEYVGGLRDIANQHGLELWLENYGHWGFISEFLLYGSQTDEVGGEIWESSDPADNVECRAAASSAHIYNKTDVFAEAFTSSRTFKQTPASLKPWCDWAFGAGINHIILHVYIHQASEKKPGIIQWFGTAFNRHNTWFDQSESFMNYMRRAAVLLKAGRPVADVAYYIGEDAPSMTGPMDPPLPDGYDFDHVNSDVLINSASVKDGKIVINNNTAYSVLVLPRQSKMRPEVAEALERLVSNGAIVIGPKPTHSPSLQGYPESDARLRNVATKLWGNLDGNSVKERQHGEGWIYDNVTLAEVFGKHKIAPDLELPGSTALPCTVAGAGKLGVNDKGGILFKHRSASDADIYFVSNTSDTTATVNASFRQQGRKPYLFDSVTGAVTPAAAFSQEDGRTGIPLHLEPSESIYIGFGESIPADSGGTADSNEPEYETLATLNNNWTSNPNDAIKHYSGTATYERTFELPELPSGNVVLDLGSVGVIASVTLNGKPVGTVWTNPWQIDITDHVQSGKNSLEIQVTNTWNNRLAADAEKPDDQRQTYVSQPYVYDKENRLMPSGLLGPVTVKAAK